jgi:hypothetical protein
MVVGSLIGLFLTDNQRNARTAAYTPSLRARITMVGGTT